MSGGAFVFLPTRAREGGGCGRWRARVAGDGGGREGRRARMGRWFDGAGLGAYRRGELVQGLEEGAHLLLAHALDPGHVGEGARGLGLVARGGAVGASAAPGASVDVIEREGRTREEVEARRGKWRARKRGWRTSRARRKAMVTDEISRGSPVLPVPDFKARAVSSRPPAGGLSTSRVRSFRRPHNRAARRGERTSERRATDRPTRTGRTVMACAASSVARALAPRLASARAARAAAAPGRALLSRHHLGGCVSAAGPDDRATARRGPGRGRGRHRGRGGKHLDDVRPRPRPRPLARASVPRARPPPIAPSTWNWAKSARRPLFRH